MQSNAGENGDSKKQLVEKLKEDVKHELVTREIAEFTVTSLADYCSIVELITYQWRKKAAERQTRKNNPAPFNCGELSPWFRGVSNQNYDCEPTLFRFYNNRLKGSEGFKGLESARRPKIHEVEDYFFKDSRLMVCLILESS